MKNKLEYNFRTPGKIEMINLMEDIEYEYKANLESSVSSFTTYDEVSNETYNDFRCVLAELKILLALAVITEGEHKALVSEANAMRLEILEGLNKED